MASTTGHALRYSNPLVSYNTLDEQLLWDSTGSLLLGETHKWEVSEMKYNLHCNYGSFHNWHSSSSPSSGTLYSPSSWLVLLLIWVTFLPGVWKMYNSSLQILILESLKPLVTILLSAYQIRARVYQEMECSSLGCQNIHRVPAVWQQPYYHQCQPWQYGDPSMPVGLLRFNKTFIMSPFRIFTPLRTKPSYSQNSELCLKGTQISYMHH